MTALLPEWLPRPESKRIFLQESMSYTFRKVTYATEESSVFINNMGGGHPENLLYIGGCVFLGKI